MDVGKLELDGGPAFPCDKCERKIKTYYKGGVCHQEEYEAEREYFGLTLRDWFAGQALAGMMANPEMRGGAKVYSADAYETADAMLAERERSRANA